MYINKYKLKHYAKPLRTKRIRWTNLRSRKGVKPIVWSYEHVNISTWNVFQIICVCALFYNLLLPFFCVPAFISILTHMTAWDWRSHWIKCVVFPSIIRIRTFATRWFLYGIVQFINAEWSGKWCNLIYTNWHWIIVFSLNKLYFYILSTLNWINKLQHNIIMNEKLEISLEFLNIYSL